MLVEHRGGRPEVHPSAWIASTAVLGGDVRVGAEARAMPRQGASLGAHRGDRIL
jgi:carbonic anhydrase/acetyltransferase-like protein (isoleucine patch superfamily)